MKTSLSFLFITFALFTSVHRANAQGTAIFTSLISFTRALGVRWTMTLCVLLLLFVQAPPAWGQTIEVLHYFQGAVEDGANPEAGLVQGTNGNFYGTTGYGGAYTNHGTVFEMTPAGALTVLYSFDGDRGFSDFPERLRGR